MKTLKQREKELEELATGKRDRELEELPAEPNPSPPIVASPSPPPGTSAAAPSAAMRRAALCRCGGGCDNRGMACMPMEPHHR